MRRRASCLWRRKSWPKYSTLPPLGIVVPRRMSMQVVLPAPLGPSNPTTVPRGIAKETPLSARREPKSLTRSRTSSRFSISVRLYRRSSCEDEGGGQEGGEREEHEGQPVAFGRVVEEANEDGTDEGAHG